MLKKSYTVVRKKGRQLKNKISFIASTETQDRYGDIVNQNGWALAAYDRNPVVLFNHQANSLPIGKGLVRVKDGQLLIDVEFDQDDEFARKIEKKARGGFLNAVSVGFNPIEAVSRSELPKDHPAYSTRGGQFFNKSELLEVSIVTIPANSEATVSAKNISKLDRLSVRDLIVEELKHILEVEQMEDGKYRIVFAGAMEEEPEEEERGMHEEEDEDRGMHKEDEKDDEKGYHDEDSEEEKEMNHDDDEDDKKDKGFLTDSERDLLRYILQS